MTLNGNFLEGHRRGFGQGAEAGWQAGYLRALKDTGAAAVGPTPQMTDVKYVAPVGVDVDLSQRLEELFDAGELSVRAYNCLNRESIHTVGELASRTEPQLLDIRNFGDKSVELVKQLLNRRGLALKDYSQESYD